MVPFSRHAFVLPTARYVMLGETVNVTTNMTSSSESNRILCSQRAATLLTEQDPQIPIQPRGSVDAGKGLSIDTFWVNEGDTASTGNVDTSSQESGSTTVEIQRCVQIVAGSDYD